MNVSDSLRDVAGGVELSVFCQPKAARSALVGMHAGSLKVKVRAPALEGRANEALLDLLGDALGVPRGRLRLVSGEQSRRKRVRVEGLDRAAAASAKSAVKEGGKEASGKPSRFDRDALATIRKRLTEQRAELQHQLTAIEESALGLSQSEMSGEVSYDEDYADAGSFTFEREKEFSIANNVSDLRDKIDRALHKIAEGSYGVCESCGKPIEGPRLKALPHVTLCLKCKKAEERR